MFRYVVSGLVVDSDSALPGLVEGPSNAAEPDVRIGRRDVPHTIGAAAHSIGPTWELDGSRFLLCIPDVARFLLSNGREIAFELLGDTTDADVAIFLIGTVFGALLHQRRQIVLHASAVRVGDKAALFCGASGAGKSTIAAALGRLGYPLINDDFCAITVDGAGNVLVQSDGRKLKLWANSIEKLDLAARRGDPVRTCLQKYYVDPEGAHCEPLPLGVIYVLREPQGLDKPGIERLDLVDAAIVLRQNAYRPTLVRRMQQNDEYFRATLAISSNASIFHLTRAKDFEKMADVLGWLVPHWREIGLADGSA